MAYGKPVVSKVTEKYPVYMTTFDTKVRTARCQILLRLRFLRNKSTLRFFRASTRAVRVYSDRLSHYHVSLSPPKKNEKKHDRLSEKKYV